MRLAILLLGVLALPACFSPDEPPCAFSCGDNNLCPNDYQCLADGYCHLHGQPGDCKYPDASAAATDGGDMSTMPVDAGADLVSPDM